MHNYFFITLVIVRPIKFMISHFSVLKISANFSIIVSSVDNFGRSDDDMVHIVKKL